MYPKNLSRAKILRAVVLVGSASFTRLLLAYDAPVISRFVTRCFLARNFSNPPNAMDSLLPVVSTKFNRVPLRSAQWS